MRDGEGGAARGERLLGGEQRPIERPERVGSHPSPAPSPLVSHKASCQNWSLMLSLPQSRGAVAPSSAGEESARSKTNRPANLNPSWDLSTSEDAYVGHFPNTTIS